MYCIVCNQISRNCPFQPATKPELSSVLTWDVVLHFTSLYHDIVTLEYLVPDLQPAHRCPSCPEVCFPFVFLGNILKYYFILPMPFHRFCSPAIWVSPGIEILLHYITVLLHIFIFLTYTKHVFIFIQTGKVVCFDGNFSLVHRKRKTVITGTPIPTRYTDRFFVPQPPVDKFVVDYKLPSGATKVMIPPITCYPVLNMLSVHIGKLPKSLTKGSQVTFHSKILSLSFVYFYCQLFIYMLLKCNIGPTRTLVDKIIKEQIMGYKKSSQSIESDSTLV